MDKNNITSKLVFAIDELNRIVLAWAQTVFPVNTRVMEGDQKFDARVCVEFDNAIIMLSGVKENGVEIYKGLLDQYVYSVTPKEQMPEHERPTGGKIPTGATCAILTHILQNRKIIGFAQEVKTATSDDLSNITLALGIPDKTETINDICKNARSIRDLVFGLHKFSAQLLRIDEEVGFSPMFNLLAQETQEYYAGAETTLEEQFPRLKVDGDEEKTRSLLLMAYRILDMYMTTLANTSTFSFPRILEMSYIDFAEKIARETNYPPLHIIISAIAGRAQAGKEQATNPSFSTTKLMDALKEVVKDEAKSRDLARMLVENAIIEVKFRPRKGKSKDQKLTRDMMDSNANLLFDKRVYASFRLPRTAFSYLMMYNQFETIVHDGDESRFKMNLFREDDVGEVEIPTSEGEA